MKVYIKWYFDIISEIENNITVAISISNSMDRGSEKSLVHIVAGKYWDIARALEKIA